MKLPFALHEILEGLLYITASGENRFVLTAQPPIWQSPAIFRDRRDCGCITGGTHHNRWERQREWDDVER